MTVRAEILPHLSPSILVQVIFWPATKSWAKGKTSCNLQQEGAHHQFWRVGGNSWWGSNSWGGVASQETVARQRVAASWRGTASREGAPATAVAIHHSMAATVISKKSVQGKRMVQLDLAKQLLTGRLPTGGLCAANQYSGCLHHPLTTLQVEDEFFVSTTSWKQM